MGKAERNKLVIIGNGFDLAHGFKTSYNNFMLWYLNDCINKAITNIHYKDTLMDISRVSSLNPSNTLKHIDSFNDFPKDYNIAFNHTISPLLSYLIKHQTQFNWIDIENEFYKYVIKIYKRYILDAEFVNHHNCISELTKLNQDFEFIRGKLEEYLTDIQQRSIDKLNPNFNQDFGYIVQDEWYDSFKDTDNKIMFLNFNYTNTIEHYTKNANTRKTKDEIIYIHGKLNDPNNPMIFGYGDEIDEHYKKMEVLNNNEFLKHFKSFGYFNTDNYQRLLSFIESDLFDVEIVGHSCGLSDRVLLNTIFEHDNCEAIKIHYYENANGENDFFYKTQEISRHFNDKAKMRKRIVDFSNCQALIC